MRDAFRSRATSGSIRITHQCKRRPVIRVRIEMLVGGASGSVRCCRGLFSLFRALIQGVRPARVSDRPRRARAERTCSATPTLSWWSADVGSPNPFNVGRFGSFDGAWARQNPHSGAQRFRLESRRVSGRAVSARTARSSLVVHVLAPFQPCPPGSAQIRGLRSFRSDMARGRRFRNVGG
jgi:anti-sigma factor RsiW